MGLEAKTVALMEGVERSGTLWLEGDHLLFRAPEYRFKIPFASMKSAAVDGGALMIKVDRGGASFALGAATAAQWLERIRNPKSLLDKLGVKPEHSVGIAGIEEESFLEQLRERLNTPPSARLKQNLDIVFVGLATPADFARIAKARAALAPAGALWLVYPKGGKSVTEAAVRAATAALCLVDTKVASFSASHTAVKVVIPVALRPGKK